MTTGNTLVPDSMVPGVQVQVWDDGARWDEFVRQASDSTAAHRWGWLAAVSAAYGHPVFGLAATRGGDVLGVLPLVLVRSRLLGRHLVSMPYLDSGGICTSGNDECEAALVSAAVALAETHRAHLELRQYTERSVGLVPLTHKVTMTLDLSAGEDAVWRRIKSNRRGQVRKAERHGLTSEVLGAEGLSDFFRVIAANMRDLGSPVHRKAFFAHALRQLGEDARIVLVRDGDEVIGAGLVLVHRGVATLPYSSSLRRAFAHAPNQILYWTAIKYAIDRGCRMFDFGRSTPASGTYEAKREWGAGAHQLYWYRRPGDDQPPNVQTQERAAALWRRLPLPLATGGGYLIRGKLPQ